MSYVHYIILILIYSPLALRANVFNSSVSLFFDNEVGRCIATFSPSCFDEYCYAHVTKHNEGRIFRLGCLSSPENEKLQVCKDILTHNHYNNTCIETGDHQMCCCYQRNGSFCNSKWKPNIVMPSMSKHEVLMLGTGVIVKTIIFYGLYRSLERTSRSLEDNVVNQYCDKVMQIELNCGFGKIILLFALVICLWYPVMPQCEVVAEGELEQKYYFIYQMSSSAAIGLFYCLYPLLMCALDLNRIRAMAMNTTISRIPYSVVSLGATAFSLVPFSMFVYQTIPVYQREFSKSYCKLGKQMTQLAFVNVCYVAHATLTIVQEAITYFLQSKHHFNRFSPYMGKNIACKSSSREEQEQLGTAKSNTTTKDEESLLLITPRPFILDEEREGILSLKNAHDDEWMTVRVLVSSPDSYIIRPHKVIIPPQKTSTISVQLCCCGKHCPPKETGLMLQWFSLSRSYLCFDATRLWQRPYLIPKSCWKFYVLPIYHDSKNVVCES
ncbi:unnamed protein product [Cylicocyclus nassatus]|uniref:Uncharacterized protein n=1 Tax=Cylicocyclus nassatus TaxID=53992 RepID=A0AA36DN93_CYLNA|nr:unnamed protein product [Cylicocyclus nassatus]